MRRLLPLLCLCACAPKPAADRPAPATSVATGVPAATASSADPTAAPTPSPETPEDASAASGASSGAAATRAPTGAAEDDEEGGAEDKAVKHPDGCSAVRAELAFELEGDDIEIVSCKPRAKAQSGPFSVELVELELDDPMSDMSTVLYMAMLGSADGEAGAWSLEEVTEARSVPGNEVSFTVGKPKQDAKRFVVEILEEDRYIATDPDPDAGEPDHVERSTRRVICDLVARGCEVESID